MIGILFGFPFKRIKEVFLNLRSKYSDRTHAPRTIIGKDYSAYLQGRVGQHQFPAAIQRFDEGDNKREKVLSVAYGPFYRAWDNQMWKMLKDQSWKHIVATSGKSEQETVRIYFEAVQKVENESRELYGGDESMDLCRDDFLWMMILDGCFLLQVALTVLSSGSEQLDHLMDFPLLIPEGVGGREEQDKQTRTPTTTTMIRVAVSSMFIVGNQIPLVLLKALMGQTFFKNFIHRGIWEEPSDLQRLALFELLLVPMFQLSKEDAVIIPSESLPDYPLLGKRYKHSRWPSLSNIFGRSRGKATRFIKSFRPFSAWHGRKKDPYEKATDILHGLWLLMTGLAGLEEDNVDRDDSDAEDIHRDDNHCPYDFVLPTVRSAKELKDIGIAFQYTGGTRINGIRFKKIRFSASLVLPRIVVVSEKEMYVLFSSLIQYEVIHFGESRRKICEYLQLMRGLVRSSDDAKVLAADGIIVVDSNLEEKIAPIFQGLDIPRLRSHQSVIKRVRDELNQYTRPSAFKKLGDVLSFVVILTVIQTVLAVLSYVQKK